MFLPSYAQLPRVEGLVNMMAKEPENSSNCFGTSDSVDNTLIKQTMAEPEKLSLFWLLID